RDGIARVGGLAEGQSRTVNVAVQISAGQLTADGNYTFVALVDAGAALAETNEGNNQATGPVVSVDQAFVDLVPTIDDIRLAPAVIAGEAVRGQVIIEIANDGNVATAGNTTIDITITATPDGEGQDVVIPFDAV